MSEPCSCDLSSFDEELNHLFCDRHKCRKTRRMVRACQNNSGLREQWDNGKGPGQGAKAQPTIVKQNQAWTTDQSKWPFWARQIARASKPGDSGVGDTVDRLAASIGGKKYKALTKSIGMPCGCSRRKKNWNNLYPYSPS